MIGTVEIKVTAARPNMPLYPMFAFQGSPSSVRVLDVPKKIGNWDITEVQFAVTYPDNTTTVKNAVRNGNVWVATVEGCEVAGKCTQGYAILANGVDENGNAVEGYVLGKGDVFVLENRNDIKALVDKIAVRFLQDIPSIPSAGDIVAFNGALRFYDGEDWIAIASATEIPTRVSQLQNDAGYITASAIPSEVSAFENDAGYITASALPSKTSELENDSGFITASAIPSNVSEFNNDAGYITASAIPSQVSAFENDAGYITASALPSKTSDLVNDSGFITASAIPSQVSAFENNVGYITAGAIPSNISSFNNDAGYLTAGSQTIQDITTSVSSIGSNVTALDASVISLGTSVSALAVSMSGKRNYPDLTYVIPSHPSEDNYPELKKWDKAAISKFVLTITGYGAESWDLNYFTTNPTEGLKWIGTPWTIYTSDGWYFYLRDADEHQAGAFRLEQFLNGDVTFSIWIGGQAYSAKLHMEQNEYCNIALDYQTSTGKLHIKRNGIDVGTYDPTVIEGTNINIVVPTNISQLNNDSEYVTAATVASNYYNKTQIDGMIGSINTVLDNINGEVI